MVVRIARSVDPLQCLFQQLPRR